MSRLEIAVIQGGPSSEAEVSRTSAAAVAEALAAAGHSVSRRDFEPALATVLERGSWDLAFPVVHGPLGEDGCLQGLLEVLGLPYVGSGVRASAVAADKPTAKACFRVAGLPVAEEVVVRPGRDLGEAAREARDRLGDAVVVKPVGGGSAIGVSRLAADASEDEVARALRAALDVGEAALVEPLVSGSEVTCGVLERPTSEAALPPTLIVPRKAGWYDFASKYAAGGSEHQCPAPFDEPLLTRIQEAAVAAHRAVGARDLSRTDFIVDEALGAITVLEVNTIPGMTATSLFPEAAAVAGIDFTALCEGLALRALERPVRSAPGAIPMP